jgi:hypothetical protein
MSITITCFVESNRKYMYNYVINVFGKSLAKLCLRASNIFKNVLPPNICDVAPTRPDVRLAQGENDQRGAGVEIRNVPVVQKFKSMCKFHLICLT